MEIDLTAIRSITFIENKTNYDAYVMSEKQPEELVVYHGGFLSPKKKRLIASIAHAASETMKIRFWADIDTGEMRFAVEIASRGGTDMVIEWLIGGMKEEKTTLIALLKRTLPQDIRIYLE